MHLSILIPSWMYLFHILLTLNIEYMFNSLYIFWWLRISLFDMLWIYFLRFHTNACSFKEILTQWLKFWNRFICNLGFNKVILFCTNMLKIFPCISNTKFILCLWSAIGAHKLFSVRLFPISVTFFREDNYIKLPTLHKSYIPYILNELILYKW